MISLDDLLAGLVQEAETDWIGLWAVMWMIQHSRPEARADECRKLTMELVQMLLRNGFVAGSVSDDGFTAWPEQSPEAAVRRIEREWDALGGDPTLGDIAWFNLLSTTGIEGKIETSGQVEDSA